MNSEILNDGSFEYTNIGLLPFSSSSGWYSTTNSKPSVTDSLSPGAHNGNKYLVFSSGFVNANQKLDTLPSTDYRLNYWIKASGSFHNNNFFQVKWNNMVIVHSQLNGSELTAIPSYKEFEFVVTASGSFSILTFETNINPSGFIYLDDVSVRMNIVRNGNFETDNVQEGIENFNIVPNGILPSHSGNFFVRLFASNDKPISQLLYTEPN
ncbi:MAG: hypothetical protein QW303_09280, partial [Nitrososphaerota archaeon]